MTTFFHNQVQLKRRFKIFRTTEVKFSNLSLILTFPILNFHNLGFVIKPTKSFQYLIK